MKEITLEDGFPISMSEATDALQALGKRIHANYTSRFTLVGLLPQALWAVKMLEEGLLEDKAQVLTQGLGMVLVDAAEGRRAVVVSPPSEHAIKGKKVVLFDTMGDAHAVVAAGRFLSEMKPATIEVASMFCKGEVPPWVNPAYVCYKIEPDVVVSGLGLGYNQAAASGAAITAERLEQEGTSGSEEAASEAEPVEAIQ